MRIFFDTEFLEDGKTIDLISIGLVREDGKTLYCISSEFDETKANDWVKKNVLAKLENKLRMPRFAIAAAILDFVGEKPEFWAYYSDYDWVALCQLYGTMMDLPKGWPMFCLDLKQLLFAQGNPRVPKLAKEHSHDALGDALWVAQTYEKYAK